MIKKFIILILFFILSCACFAAEIDDQYLICPGDKLLVVVWKDPSLTMEITVRPDGKISFPLAGEVHVAGRKVMEVQKILAERIKEYLPDLPLTVIVSGLNNPKLYVIGHVKNPGMYLIGMHTTVIQALGMTGGFTTFASPKKIIILRRKKKEDVRFKFNYNDVIKGKNPEQNIELKGGDVLIIP